MDSDSEIRNVPAERHEAEEATLNIEYWYGRVLANSSLSRRREVVIERNQCADKERVLYVQYASSSAVCLRFGVFQICQQSMFLCKCSLKFTSFIEMPNVHISISGHFSSM
jgi:hypothetical protein